MWVKVRGISSEPPPRERPDVWAGRGIEIDPAPLEAEPEASEPGTASDEATRSSALEHDVSVEPVCANGCIPANEKKPPRPTERAVPEKPRAAATKLAPPAPSATATATAASSIASGTPGASEAYGAVGLPPGVRGLPKAYARALSEGSYGIAEFRTAPVGKLCDARLAIPVEEDSRLGELQYESDEKRDALPRACRKMFDNVMIRLRAGQFSVDPSKLTSGVMRIRVSVEVTDEEPHLDADREPKDLWSESHEEPRPGRRGRSTFVLNCGRRVDALIDLE
ncbi:MAG TPA: hypothetical protein VF103_05390 [Polyangiaceae bacterium]